MSACRCGSPPRASVVRRVTNVAVWILPSGLLALMPKCPLCLAAYVAMATGLGLSFSTAALLRWGLVASCVLILIGLALRQASRWWATCLASKESP